MVQHHHLEELVDALRQAVGKPPIKRPSPDLKQECESEGLSESDFATLNAAIAQSKHSMLAARSIRLLVPRRKLGAKDLRVMVGGYSQTDSSVVRSNWCRYFCALWDADALSMDGKDCLHSGYGVFFHFLQNERSQTETCRLLYRLTRKVDVTPFRCHEVSKILSKLQNASSAPVMALAELFDSFRENSIVFPPREYGLPGSSGLTQATKIKLHEKISRPLDYEWIHSLRRHAIEVVESDSEEDIAARTRFLSERRHPVARPKILNSILAGESAQSNFLLSDVFRVSKLGMIDNDPKEELEKDVQSALMAHLATWDGYAAQDETFEVFSRLSFPRKTEQPVFERSVIFPMLDLFSSCSVVFKFRASRAFARLLGNWIVNEEGCGPFVQRICGFLDDAFCAALIFEKDDPLVQLGCVEFFLILGRALLNRSKVFGTAPSPAVPPSEHLALRLLLSPTVVGVTAMSSAFVALFPVYRVENTAGTHTSTATKLQAARYFQNLAQEYVTVLALKKTGFAPFEEFLKVGSKSNERSLLGEMPDVEVQGDELGVIKSFAFAGLWMRWWEERDEIPEAEPSDERVGAFLAWLKKFTPGVPKLIFSLSTKFNKLSQGEDEE